MEPIDRPDPARPAFQPGSFIGRDGMVRNLLRRLERGQSLSIVGGPKLGKTSLLLHLAWHVNQTSESLPSSEPVAEYFDLAVDADHDRLRSSLQQSDGIVLLDNCDRLVDGYSFSVADLQLSSRRAMVWAGSRIWHEFVEAGGIGSTVKTIPLAVFLEKEAKLVLGQSLSQEQQHWVCTFGGTHPFLLKMLQAEILEGALECHLDHISPDVNMRLDGFFQSCVDQLRDPHEHHVLMVLIERGQPMNPKEAAAIVGLSNIRPLANTLCYLGLISRWIRDEEATLFAGSQLFNEWYVESRAS